MADETLRLVEKAKRAAEAVLQAGLESGDTKDVIAGVREVFRALEMEASLKVAEPPPDVSFDAEISELILAVTSQASPACARCGESCSACASEALPMGSIEDLYRSKAALARDRAPGGAESDVEVAVVVPDVPVLPEPAERPAAPSKPKALPPSRYDGPPGPVSVGGPGSDGIPRGAGPPRWSR